VLYRIQHEVHVVKSIPLFLGGFKVFSEQIVYVRAFSRKEDPTANRKILVDGGSEDFRE